MTVTKGVLIFCGGVTLLSLGVTPQLDRIMREQRDADRIADIRFEAQQRASELEKGRRALALIDKYGSPLYGPENPQSGWLYQNQLDWEACQKSKGQTTVGSLYGKPLGVHRSHEVTASDCLALNSQRPAQRWIGRRWVNK